MSDENNPDLQTWIDPDIEARVVAWVLGEASEFEAAELERLIVEKPELGIFKRRIETVHGLIVEATRIELDPMRLAEERRRKLLETLGGKEAGAKAVVVALPQRRLVAKRGIPWKLLGGIAACLAVVAVITGLFFPALNAAKHAAFLGANEHPIQGLVALPGMVVPASPPQSFAITVPALPAAPKNLPALASLKALASRERAEDDDGSETSEAASPSGAGGKVDDVKNLFSEAKGYEQAGRYDKAYQDYDKILNADPYNVAARKGQEAVNAHRDNDAQEGYDETRSEMLWNLDNGWQVPDQKFGVKGPENFTPAPTDVRPTDAINKKLNSIIIPRIEFRDATVREALDFLKEKSRELDTQEPDPTRRGINIVDQSQLDNAPDLAPAPAPAIPGLEQAPASSAPAASPASNEARLTLSLTNIPLIEALKYVGELANLKVKVDPYAVSIVPPSVNTDELITKVYTVPAGFLANGPDLSGESALSAPATRGGGGGGGAGAIGGNDIGHRQSAMDYLTSQGIQFPPGAAAVYNPATGKLIVHNTASNIELLDASVEACAPPEPAPADAPQSEEPYEPQMADAGDAATEELAPHAIARLGDGTPVGAGDTGTAEQAREAAIPGLEAPAAAAPAPPEGATDATGAASGNAARQSADTASGDSVATNGENTYSGPTVVSGGTTRMRDGDTTSAGEAEPDARGATAGSAPPPAAAAAPATSAGGVQAPAPAGPAQEQQITSGLRSGSYAVSSEAIDSLLFPKSDKDAAGAQGVAGKAQPAPAAPEAAPASPAVIAGPTQADMKAAKPAADAAQTEEVQIAQLRANKQDEDKKLDQRELKAAEPASNGLEFGMAGGASATVNPSATGQLADRSRLIANISGSLGGTSVGGIVLNHFEHLPDSATVTTESGQKAKIPILGDIPILGYAYRSNPQQAQQPAPLPQDEIRAADQPYSTFSLHVSDVSFLLASASLANGQLPDPDSIRPEEFYNAFDYGDPAPATGEKIACAIEQAAHPLLQQRNLVRIAMKVAATGRGQGQPLRLTVLLDTSGSMEREDRAASVQRAMQVLTSLLGPGDAVTLLGFARQPRLLAEAVPGDQAGKLVDIVKHTPAEGGTNMEEALKAASELALKQFVKGGQNRVVMLTDGAANLGDADPAQLSKLVESLRQQGVSFDACGVGANGLNDDILEALTRKGGGRYYFLNEPEDADAGFARQLAGAFRPAAENVKMQVRFNPARVGNYRLIGFEKNRLKQEDFRNDKVTAAQLAAEEAGVALYQVQVLPEGEGEVGEVFVRFLDPNDGRVTEQSWTIPYDAQAPALDKASPSMQLATTAALVAEKLRGGPLAEALDMDALAPIVGRLRGDYPNQARVQDLATMFEQVRRMTAHK